jgi:hypothetical protein
MKKCLIVLFAICLIAMMVVPAVAMAGDCDHTHQHLQDGSGDSCTDILWDWDYSYDWSAPGPHGVHAP